MFKEKLESLIVSTDISIKQAMQKINETGERILFVTNGDGNLLGTVTDGDIRRGIIKGTEFSEKIGTIMHRGFFAITLNTPSIKENAKKLMVEHKIEQIPVVNSKGIITDVILWTDILGEQRHFTQKQIKQNQAVIMAGGKGSRLDPFTKIFPKPLIPIGNKPVIEIIMERFYRSGFHKFIYTLNYKKEYVKVFLKENNFPYDIEWIEEEDFLGTAGSLYLLKKRISDTFFVINCDSLVDVDFDEVLKWHKENHASMTIIGCHNEVKIPFGVLELSNGKLAGITEKPVHDVIVNTGVYIMEPHIISYIPEGQYLDMNDLITMVALKEKITVYPIYNGWFDIGQWDEYKKSIKKLGDIGDV